MDKETMKREQDLIDQIKKLVGELGALMDTKKEDDKDFHIQDGLARVTTELFDFDSDKIIFWLGYPLINCGLEADERFDAILDALKNEVGLNIFKAIEKEKKQKKSKGKK